MRAWLNLQMGQLPHARLMPSVYVYSVACYCKHSPSLIVTTRVTVWWHFSCRPRLGHFFQCSSISLRQTLLLTNIVLKMEHCAADVLCGQRTWEQAEIWVVKCATGFSSSLSGHSISVAPESHKFCSCRRCCPAAELRRYRSRWWIGGPSAISSW